MFEAALAETAATLDQALRSEVARLPAGRLRDAIAHALEGGKRLRGFLVLEGARLHGVAPAQALRAAAAVECIHAYSLVHDDLPAMDDDDMRRGRPTVHVAFDEATAILVGDALQALAFEILSSPGTHPDGAVRADLVARLAAAAGARGMVLGQMRDIAAERAGGALGPEEVAALQALKTGALFRWSAEAGARLAGADPAPLAAYADALGLAFQIADDILDVAGEEARTGKRLRKDAAAGKATFVSLLGLEGARARAEELVSRAIAALEPYGPRADLLREAARFAISRET